MLLILGCAVGLAALFGLFSSCSVQASHRGGFSCCRGLPRWRSGKESNCQWRRRRKPGSVPGWGRSPGVRNGNPLQYSCLANPVDRGAWWASLWGHKESDMIKHAILKCWAPPVAEHRLQACGLQQSQCTGLVVALVLWSRGWIVVAHRLSCSVACWIFLDWNCVPCIGRWILIHCTTREVQYGHSEIFQTINMGSLSICLCLLQFLSSKSCHFLCTDFWPPWLSFFLSLKFNF